MTVSNEAEFRVWLEAQPREVCVAIAFRAAMRVFPLITIVAEQKMATSRLTLLTARALLTSGIASVRPTSDVEAVAAAAAYAASHAYDAKAAVTAAAVVAAVEATNAVTNSAAYSANAAAGAANSAFADAASATATALSAVKAASAGAAYTDTKQLVSADVIASATNLLSFTLRAVLERWGAARVDILRSGGPWTFWAEWYDRAMAGDPLPWDLQEQIALIPDEIWEAGPEAVAEEIEGIQRDHVAENGQLLETLVLDPEVPVYSAKTVEARNPDRVRRHLSRVEDALDDLCALSGNNGLSEQSAEYRIIKRLVRKYSDDPERIAFDLTDVNWSISRQITSGEYPESEPFTLLQAAATTCISTICDMQPEVAEELDREYPGPGKPPTEEEAETIVEAIRLSTEVLDAPATETSEEDIAELFYNRIIDAAKEDPLNGPLRVATEYRAVVLRRQISRLAQIARDYATVDKLAEHYDSKHSKAAGVVMRYGGVAGLLWHAVKGLGRMLGIG